MLTFLIHSGTVFFCWRVLHPRIHLVFQLQFFISSTFCQRCIKLATQNCFSALDRLGCLRIRETVPFMGFYVFKAASEDTKLDFASRSLEEELLLFSHLSGERKSERNMRLCCKDIELLLLYKGRLKAGLLGKSSRI